MSKTLTTLSGSHPLQLDFSQPGSLCFNTKGYSHKKRTPYCILLTVSTGSYHLQLPDRDILLLPGRVAFIPANTTTTFVHQDGPEDVMEASWLHFRFSLYALVDYLSLFDTPTLLPTAVCPTLRGFIQSAAANKSSSLENIVRQHSLTAQALEIIVSASTRNEDAWRALEGSRLRPVLHFIRENLREPLSVEQLAKHAGLSPSRFHALFDEDFGCSPMKYVKQQRLETAARLLTGSESKLAEIAEITGFADAFHLSHAFKAYHGTPPKVYRQQAQNWTNID